MKNTKIATAVIAAVLGTSLVADVAIAASPSKKVEKCYGIVKAKKNDCGTPKHACAGQSKTDGSKSEWMYVLKGNCNRIIGGSLTPEK